MFAEERQAKIVELAAGKGRVSTAELTKLFGVTEPTIRRDLDELERRRLLKRTHGGAVRLRSLVEPGWDARAALNPEGKSSIARACLKLINEGDSMFLDSGTTILRIAEELGERHVNLLTNSLRVASAVSGSQTIQHTVLGGQLLLEPGCFVGPLALESLERFSLTLAFIGVSGFSESGISVIDLGEAQLKAAVIERAARVIVPLDHRKVGATDFARVCGLEAIDVVVTDRITEPLRVLCTEHNIELIEGATY